MAGPNARVALMAFPTYRTLAPGHKDAWIAHLERLGPGMTDCLRDGEVFKSEEHCRLRLDGWGFKEGCRYTVGRAVAREIHRPGNISVCTLATRGLRINGVLRIECRRRTVE